MTSRTLQYTEAIDAVIADAMAADERIVLFGEDVQMLRSALYARFGGDRVLSAPISESAFLGAAVGAAMGGLRPIAELLMIDFVAVAFDAVLNHMAKLEAFSGVCKYPARVKCATLAWHTVDAALEGREQTVSTE